jgi:hypothetical protein
MLHHKLTKLTSLKKRTEVLNYDQVEYRRHLRYGPKIFETTKIECETLNIGEIIAQNRLEELTINGWLLPGSRIAPKLLQCPCPKWRPRAGI